MAELVQTIDNGFAHVTSLLKQVKDVAASERGNLSVLTTTNKASLVAALNELKSIIDNKSNIDDATTSTGTSWSSTKISSEIGSQISVLLGGVDPDSDTLKELADQITSLAQADNGLVSATNAQSFTEAQMTQARENIDAASATEVGNIQEADFVATIDAAYAG